MSLDSVAVSVVSEIRHPILDVFMENITHLGSVWFASIIAVLVIWKHKKTGILFSVCSIATLGISFILKMVIARPRPGPSAEHVSSILFSTYSFPSAHTSLAFAMAFILSEKFGMRPLFFSLAALIAISRVYIGVHYLTDIIAGSILGILIGVLVMKKRKIIESLIK